MAHLLTPSFQVLSFHLQGCGGDNAAEHCGELLPTCESFSVRQRVTVMHPAPEAIHFRFIETRPCLLASTRFGTNRLTFRRSFCALCSLTDSSFKSRGLSTTQNLQTQLEHVSEGQPANQVTADRQYVHKALPRNSDESRNDKDKSYPLHDSPETAVG